LILLRNIHNQPIDEQKEIIESTLENWENINDQVDDTLFMGIKV